MASVGPRVTLFVPVLNEIEGMKAILPQIRPEWSDQILVVDGGSSDGSLEYAKELGLETYVQRRKGIRFACMEAWPLIRGDVVITFSPDGNCPVEEIPCPEPPRIGGKRKLQMFRWGGAYLLQTFRETYHCR